MTTVDERPTPMGFGRMQRKEDAALHPRQGQLRRRRPAARACCTARCCAARYAHARIVSIDTTAAEAHPKVKAVITGDDAGRPQPGLDADAVATTCRPCSPPTRCASRARRSRSSSPRTTTPPATRSSSSTSSTSRCRRSSTPAGRSTRTPRSSATTRRARPTTTSSTGRPATRDRTDAVFASAEVVVAEDMLYPRVHPAPLETCGAVADYRPGHRQADALVRPPQAPHAHRTRVRAGRRPARAQDPGDRAGHRRRLRQQGRHLPRLRAARSSARSSPASR